MFSNQTSKVKWSIFTVSAIGGFLAMMDSNTVNVALYEIAKNFNITIPEAQWAVTAYILILSTFLTLFGKLNDLISRKKLYALGYLVFALGALFNTLSFNLITLILSRIVQATGASILLSNNYAIISSIFKGNKRAKALGFSTALMALAGMSGPIIGGFLMHYISWRAIFIPSIIIGLLGAYFSMKVIPEIIHKNEFHFDYPGMGYMLISTLSMLLIISKGHDWGWGSNRIICLFITFVIFSIIFYFREKSYEYPVLNFELFKSKVFTYGNFALLVAYFALFTNALLFPFYTQEVLGETPLMTAVLILPFSIMFMVLALLNGKLTKKLHSSILMTTGTILIILGYILFTTISDSLNLVNILIAQALIGAGSGCYQPSVNALIVSVAPIGKMGIASGILAMFRNVGMLLGISISVSIFDYIKNARLEDGIQQTQAFVDGYHYAIYWAIFFGIICAILSYMSHKAYKLEKLKNEFEIQHS